MDVSDGTVPTETASRRGRDSAGESVPHRVARARRRVLSTSAHADRFIARVSDLRTVAHPSRITARASAPARPSPSILAAMRARNAPVVKDLVLIGGGHAHVYVLKSLAMNPCEGARVTLIAKDLHTPLQRSMLPGLVAGHYSWEETHVDLEPICRSGNFRVIHDEAVGIDHANKRVLMRSGRPGCDSTCAASAWA